MVIIYRLHASVSCHSWHFNEFDLGVCGPLAGKPGWLFPTRPSCEWPAGQSNVVWMAGWKLMAIGVESGKNSRGQGMQLEWRWRNSGWITIMMLSAARRFLKLAVVSFCLDRR